MRSKILLTLSLALFLLAVPAMADDDAAQQPEAVLVELDCADDDALFTVDELLATNETDLMTPAQSVGFGGSVDVLGCVAATCDDYPSTPWSTCSCSSELVRERCQRSCDKKKGQKLRTTCTINPGCAFPPCEIQQPIVRNSFSCVPLP